MHFGMLVTGMVLMVSCLFCILLWHMWFVSSTFWHDWNGTHDCMPILHSFLAIIKDKLCILPHIT